MQTADNIYILTVFKYTPNFPRDIKTEKDKEDYLAKFTNTFFYNRLNKHSFVKKKVSNCMLIEAKRCKIRNKNKFNNRPIYKIYNTDGNYYYYGLVFNENEINK